MYMKTGKILSAALGIAVLAFAIGCKKSETKASLPTVTTSSAITVASTSATCGGSVAADASNAAITARGICYSTTNPTPDLTCTVVTSGTGAGSFTCNLTNLSLFSTYYFRAYATNSAGTAYGAAYQFQLGVGLAYQGGIIAYVLQPNDPGYSAGTPHGLVAAPSDQSANSPWYNGTYTSTGATGTAIGNGATNTNNIVTVQGVGNYAARLCDTLTLGGYTDWYLPSKDELNLIYQNRNSIGGFSTTAGYWSSSEADVNDAWSQNFSNGTQISFNKNNTSNATRAVRSF